MVDSCCYLSDWDKDMIDRSVFAIQVAQFRTFWAIILRLDYQIFKMNPVWLIICWMIVKSPQSWGCVTQVYCRIDPQKVFLLDALTTGRSNESTAHRLTASSLHCSHRHQKIIKTTQVTSRNNNETVERKRGCEISVWSNGMTLVNNYTGEAGEHGFLFKIPQ